jgi:hypothetical protein
MVLLWLDNTLNQVFMLLYPFSIAKEGDSLI